ncbi:MAG TPA: hypothetical protein VHO29_16060 [Marmoricola sp.]|nr:hypothetical protein [Marmoricola sp.]
MSAGRRRAESSGPGVRIGALATVAGLAVLTGCGGGSDATTVTGSCAMDAKTYAKVSPLSAADLEALLGKGSYRVEGNVRPGSDGVPDAGECSYARADKPDELLLQVGVNRQTDLFSSYDESRTLQSSGKATPIEGADGYVVPDPGSGPGSGNHGPLAVVFGDGHRMVTLHLVQDRPSVSDRSMNSRLARAGKHAAQALGRPMQRH